MTYDQAQRRDALQRAAQREAAVTFVYRDAEGHESARLVRPQPLTRSYGADSEFVLAFDLDREDYRQFRIERILGRVRPAPAGVRGKIPA